MVERISLPVQLAWKWAMGCWPTCDGMTDCEWRADCENYVEEIGSRLDERTERERPRRLTAWDE